MGCNQADNIIQDIASFINELLDIETKKTSFESKTDYYRTAKSYRQR